jgi:hypothetical protein
MSNNILRFIGGLLLLSGVFGLGYCVWEFARDNELKISAVAEEGTNGITAIVTLVNRSPREVRVLGNVGQCGEGGCILPLAGSDLSDLLPVESGKSVTLRLPTRQTPGKEFRGTTLLYVDDGTRLRNVVVWIRREGGVLTAGVEPEQDATADPGT